MLSLYIEGVERQFPQPAGVTSKTAQTDNSPEEANARAGQAASLEQDYSRLITGAALADFPNLSILQAYGPDTSSFLQGMVTNDVAKLQPGEGCLAALLNPIGKVISDLIALKLHEERFWIIIRQDRREKVDQSLKRFIVSDDVETGALEDWSALGVLGPQSRERLGAVFPRLPEKSLASLEFQIDGDAVRVLRHLRLGIDGYHLWVPAARHDHWSGLIKAKCGLESVPDRVLEVIRIEAGVPEYGIDFDESNIPLESNLDDLLDFQKGCYTGQEIVSRVTYLGNVSRKLVGLLANDVRIPEKGEEIRLGDQAIGRITSAAWSPALKQPIALGYVQRKFLEYGKEVELASGIKASISQLPLVTVESRRSKVESRGRNQSRDL